MKLEIEISEDILRESVNRQIRDLVESKANAWGTEKLLREAIESQWGNVVTRLVTEALQDSPKLKAKIAAEIERKLRAQLNAAIKSQST